MTSLIVFDITKLVILFISLLYIFFLRKKILLIFTMKKEMREKKLLTMLFFLNIIGIFLFLEVFISLFFKYDIF